jgi:YD repeat-containing protein
MMKTAIWKAASAAVAIGLAFAQVSHAAPRVGIERGGTERTRLSWNSTSNVSYSVQAVRSLPNAEWDTLENVLARGDTAEWTDPGENAASRFYRLVQPAARFSGFEPVNITTNGGQVAYVLGQNLGGGVELRIDGAVVPGASVLSSGLMRIPLPDLSPGPHTIALVAVGSGEVLDVWSNAFFVVSGRDETHTQFPESSPARPVGPVRWMAPEALRGRRGPAPSQAMITNMSQLPAHRADTWPVFFAGELRVQAVDLHVPGVGFDFVFVRTYRSRTGEDTPLGHRWDHSYNVSLEEASRDAIVLRSGQGRRDTFYRRPDGTFVRDGFFATIGDPDRDSRPDLLFADRGRWTFHAFDGTPRAGRLIRSADRNGNAMTFSYSPLGLVTGIVDTLDRSIALAYDPGGRLVSVTDFAGRSVTYDYYGPGETGGSSGDLKSITTPAVTGTPNTNDFPRGKTTVFSYTTAASTGQTDERALHDLISITDPKGQNALRVDYDTTGNPEKWNFGCVTSLRRGIEKADIRRGALIPSPSNRFATVRAIVNDWVGNVSEYDFDSLGRPVAVRRYTGRATPNAPTTATQNRPRNPLRPTDPPWFETTHAWNRDSLLSEVLYPAGNRDQFVYARDVDPGIPRAKAGDLRLRRLLPGPRDADQDELTEVYRHHALFGSDPTSSQGAGSRRFKAGAALAKTVNVAFGGGDTSGDQALEFVTSIADSRRNAAQYTYDANGNLTSVVSPDPSVTQDYEYSADGRCTAHVHPPDAAGRRRRDVFTYYDTGQQRGHLRTTVVDETGLNQVTTYEYDSVGNVTRAINPRGYDDLWMYSALNQVVQHTCPDFGLSKVTRVKTDFFYDANDNLVQVRTENRDDTGELDMPSFFDVFFAYDPVDNLTQRVDVVGMGDAITNRFLYDGNRNRVRTESPDAVSGNDPTNVVTFMYDERDLLLTRVRAERSPLQSTDTFDYDENGNLMRRGEDMERPAGASVTTFEYDGFDRLMARTDPMGNRVALEYDPNGNVVRQRVEGELQDNSPDGSKNRLLEETQVTYDPLNRPTYRIDSFFDIFTELSIDDGRVETHWDYAPNGTGVSIVDDLGHATLYDYDPLRRLTALTDPAGNVVEYDYDASDNVTSVVRRDRSGTGGSNEVFRSSYEYDGLDRCVAAADWYRDTGKVIRATSHFLYDSHDDLVSEVDPRGNETRHEYDGLGRRVRVKRIDAASPLLGGVVSTTEYEYDDNSRCVAITDANTNTTRFVYDSLDRLTTRRGGDLGEHLYVWASRSELASSTDPNGTQIDYVYDRSHRLRRGTIRPGPGVAETTTQVTYDYDGRSRLVAAQNGVAQCQFAYDSLGNLVRETVNGRSTAYAYDSLGNRLSTTTPGGSLVTYAYDDLNRVSQVLFTAPGERSLQVETRQYNGLRLGRLDLGNGTATDVTYGGNLVGRPNPLGDANVGGIAQVRHTGHGGGVTLAGHVCMYDPNQNLTDRLSVIPQTAGTYAFEFDALNRITRSTITTNETIPPVLDRTYTYDAVGNTLSVSGFPGAGHFTLDPTLPEPGDFQANQYTTTPYDQREYDRNGNLRGHFTPTDECRYRSDYANRLVSVSNATHGVLMASYEYDPLGRRISRYDGISRMRTDYVYEGGRVIEELTNGVPTRAHVTGSLSQDDGVVSTFTWSQRHGPFWHHTDDEGSVVALSDAEGHVLERYQYDELGGTTVKTPDGQPRVASVVGNECRYRGMQWDAGAMFYVSGGGAALYDPLIGRAPGPPRIGIIMEYAAVSFPVAGSASIGNASAMPSGGGFPGAPCRSGIFLPGGDFSGISGYTYVMGGGSSNGEDAWSAFYCFDNVEVRGWNPRTKKKTFAQTLGSVRGKILLPGGDFSGVSGYTYASGGGSGVRWESADYSPSSRHHDKDVAEKTNKSEAARARRRAVAGSGGGGFHDCFPTTWKSADGNGISRGQVMVASCLLESRGVGFPVAGSAAIGNGRHGAAVGGVYSEKAAYGGRSGIGHPKFATVASGGWAPGGNMRAVTGIHGPKHTHRGHVTVLK